MHMDPVMPLIVGAAFLILLLGVILRRFGQPYLVGYLLAGLLLGPAGAGLITDTSAIARLGEMGVVLLLFFAGMEVSLPKLVARWRVPVFGTLLQIAASIACVVAVGWWLDWEWQRMLLLGFVISLSSTAVVFKLLHERGDTGKIIGRDVASILLAQDLLVIPMLIIVGLLSGAKPTLPTAGAQFIGTICTVALLAWLARGHGVRLPFAGSLKDDKELQVFGAFMLCFGFGFLTGLASLSVALGAFVAGILVGSARETHWVHEALYPFQVLLLALFFVSIGMMIDLNFVWQKIHLVALLLLSVVVTNTVVNAGILRILGRSWKSSVYGGALLSPIGEFSFVLAAVGRQTGLIEEFSYQITVAMIALGLLITPFWVGICSHATKRGRRPRPAAAVN